MPSDHSYDYVIVGGGTAGCVLANRLTDGGKHSVLLLEAGPEDRYPWIHIPIGYDGIPLESEAAIVRAMKETEGPVYFHCHHGLHRGPAAAAIATAPTTLGLPASSRSGSPAQCTSVGVTISTVPPP